MKMNKVEVPRTHQHSDPASIWSVKAVDPEHVIQLVSSHPRRDKRPHWSNKGYIPARKGDGLIVNEALMQTSADGTLRVGNLEVWVTHQENYDELTQEKRAKAAQSAALLNAVNNVRDAAAAIDGLISIERSPRAQSGRRGIDISDGTGAICEPGAGEPGVSLGDLTLEPSPT